MPNKPTYNKHGALRILRQSLLLYLRENRLPYSRVLGDDFKDKAVVRFSLLSTCPPRILFGPFQDALKEIICIAHEAGHIIAYNNMDGNESRTYLCAMFASTGIGLSGISTTGQAVVLGAEAEASAFGLDLLKEIGLPGEDHPMVTAQMAAWYATYEVLCRDEIVIKLREKIGNNKNTAFLVSRPVGPLPAFHPVSPCLAEQLE